jgi:outer membrane protein
MKKLLISILIAATGLVMAGEQKIAVVDMEKIFYEYHRTKISDGNLKKQAEIYRAYAEKLKESLLKLQEEYKQLRDNSLSVALSDNERENKRIAAQDKYRQLKAKETELKQYELEKQSHLKEEYEKKRKELLKEIKKEIKKRCALEGYTIVFDKSGKTLNNIAVIIDYSPSIDLTDDIIKELNRGHKTEKTIKK